jgi:glycosyltransferase involved in cell wall biosynthesis
MAEPSGRAGVVFNGVSVADFDRGEPHPHPHPYILGIGRVVPQKGFDVLIKAFAHSGVRDHDLLIAGDGPERAGLEGLARDCGLTDRVRFVGRADRPKAVSLFRGASFVALPSRADEGLPVVTVETMAAGKALVACRVGGVPESVMDGETGIIVPRDDVEAFAAGLRDLAGDPARRAAYGEAARQRAQLFDWDVIADRYVEVYQAVRGGGGRTATAASGRGRAAVAVGAPS